MEQAYDEIKRRIITLELMPGEKVDDYQISTELNFSRTPVREAVLRLATEGLVEIRVRTGFFVRPLDLIDIADLFETNVVLAKAVARLTAIRVSETELSAIETESQQVDAAIASRDYIGITRHNTALHRLEAAASHNQHLCEMACKVHDYAERLAYLCFGGGREWGDLDTHFEKTKRHHRELLDAYRSRDVATAEAVSVAHVHSFRRRVQTLLASEAIDGFELADRDLFDDYIRSAHRQ